MSQYSVASRQGKANFGDAGEGLSWRCMGMVDRGMLDARPQRVHGTSAQLPSKLLTPDHQRLIVKHVDGWTTLSSAIDLIL